MPQLPPELWLRISNCLVDADVVRLIGVNLTLYNVALDVRYGTVHIHTVSAKTKRLFERLRDPVPASRVRRLIVCPHITLSPPPAGPVSLLWNRIFSTVSRTARTPPIERLVDALMLIFPNLVNLRSFEVEAWDMAPGYDLRGFFRSAWAAFGPKLEAVSIGGRPENFRQFVESEPDIASCTCLNLQFTHEHEMDAHAAVVGILTDCVAPYITHLAPQLEILKIWSWSTLDLSALFLHLGQFPRLREFYVSAPFNKAFTNPAGLTSVLNSATLERVELRLKPAGSAMDPSSEQMLGQWFLSHQDHPRAMRDLKTLLLYPTNLSTGFDALLMYLERSANTLTTLAVKDRYLNLDEVGTLIAPLTHRTGEHGLQSLRLHVRVWSPELFDVLASKLPGLQSLSLYIGGTQPDRAEAELFFAKMQNHNCRSWKLRDVGIWQGGAEVSSNIMILLADCIPSIQSFWGNGHMSGNVKI